MRQYFILLLLILLLVLGSCREPDAATVEATREIPVTVVVTPSPVEVTTFYPNGANCEPVCQLATAVLTWPEAEMRE